MSNPQLAQDESKCVVHVVVLFRKNNRTEKNRNARSEPREGVIKDKSMTAQRLCMMYDAHHAV